MKQTNILQTIILFLGILLLTVGCNSDNDGIFRLISQSEETVEIGTVTLITHSGATLFAHTSKGGLQSYDTLTKVWNKITPLDSPVYSDQVSTDGTDVFYYARSSVGVNNTLYFFPKAGPYTSVVKNSLYDILSMAPQHDLMTIKDGTDVKVVRSSNGATLLATYADHNTDVLLLSQSDNYYLLSGYEMVGGSKEYQNILYNGTHEVTFTGMPTSIGVRAFFAAGTSLALVATNGDVYYNNGFNLSAVGADVAVALSKGGSVPLATTSTPLTHLPVIHKAGESVFYIQGDNGYIYKVDPATGVTTDATFNDINITVTVSSFYYDGADYYIGTQKNGIIKVESFPAP